MKTYAFKVKDIDWDLRKRIQETNERLGIDMPTTLEELNDGEDWKGEEQDSITKWYKDGMREMINQMDVPLGGLPTELMVYITDTDLDFSFFSNKRLAESMKDEYPNISVEEIERQIDEMTLEECGGLDFQSRWEKDEIFRDNLLMTIQGYMMEYFNGRPNGYPEYVGIVERPDNALQVEII